MTSHSESRLMPTSTTIAAEKKRRKPIQEIGIDRLSHLFSFDFESGKMFWKNPKNRSKMSPGDEAGAAGRQRSKSYWYVHVDGAAYKRARLIFYMFHGRLPKMIDHADGDSLNDRISNLREATASQNAWNVKKQITSKFGLPVGVRQVRSDCGRFDASLMFKGKNIYLGAYDTPEEARAAYVRKKRELCGDFSPC